MLVGLVVSIFTTDRLTRFCLYTPLKVLVISLGIVALLWVASGYLFDGTGAGVYFEVKGKDLFLYPFFLCFLCSMASYSIFLCKMREVRGSRLLSFLCFMVLPLAIAGIFIFSQYDSGIRLLQTIYYSIAFVIPQGYFYVFFLRKQAKGEWDKGN